MYRRKLEDGIVISSTRPEHAEQLEDLQETVFPTLAPEQLLRAPHYRRHLELFPRGQFVALDDDRVVGMTSTIRRNFDFDDIHHTFEEIIQGGWLTSHQPDGSWLYGADMGTHPDYRRRGIARALYRARHETVRELGLKGQLAVGMMNGYGEVSDRMSGEEYYERLRQGDISDPTITAQQRVGFEIRGLIANYVQDPACGNYGVLIVLPAEEEVREGEG